ncbi:MAG: phage tail assembly protein [Pseudomonadota bacterium]
MSKEITLKYPIKTGAGATVEKLTVSRLKRADLKAAARYSKEDDEQEDFLMSRMTGLQIEDLDQLDIADSKVLADTFREMVGG